jgi:hypothetical protein
VGSQRLTVSSMALPSSLINFNPTASGEPIKSDLFPPSISQSFYFVFKHLSNVQRVVQCRWVTNFF